MPSPNSITVSQLSRLIGTPDAPVILDVRIDEDVDEDPRLVPAARRVAYQDMAHQVTSLKNCRVVVICHRGKKLSEGAVAVLRERGVSAEKLVGGHVAWREAGEMLVPIKCVPSCDSSGRTVWVTRHRPKIDRIACPWLIRRFIDPDAQFLFVSPAEVMAVAEHFSATPFDIEDVFWSHREDRCTFDTMIEEFALRSSALKHLATIVRGADTNRHQLAPEAAGLLAVSLGLSRQYRDDTQQLNAGMAIYDAFYRWTRDARDEMHDWPSESGSK
ncbi:MAG: sulfurtransferase/chromate resistance protein [Granulosicoccus sp.]